MEEKLIEMFEEIFDTREVKVISYDFSDLYVISAPQKSPTELLMRILEYYDLVEKILVVLDCPFDHPDGKCFIQINNTNVEERTVKNYLEIVKKLPDEAPLIIIRVFDGYDVAEAIVKLDKE